MSFWPPSRGKKQEPPKQLPLPNLMFVERVMCAPTLYECQSILR